jgi:hypothetical protein
MFVEPNEMKAAIFNCQSPLQPIGKITHEGLNVLSNIFRDYLSGSKKIKRNIQTNWQWLNWYDAWIDITLHWAFIASH